ncbi:MAG: ASKHA domain-containing protein [Planctomycetaceae bacterium]|jgi:uncharacterized 2Fe-2S/4Fe-4S cluster protein (DUF4445 family)|nr:ASKHA domain-containing protein [Planctomycetaceae bacterium]
MDTYRLIMDDYSDSIRRMLYNICFQFEDQDTPACSVLVPAGTPLSAAAAELGITLRTPCGGNGTCKKCKCSVNGQEILACQSVVERNLTVNIPKTSVKSNEESIVVQTGSSLLAAEFVPLPLIAGQVPPPATGYGVAFDIGTTTLAAELFALSPPPRVCGVSALANPQRSFGDDLITRIQKVIEDPAAAGALQGAVIQSANKMFAELAENAGIKTTDITAVSVAGNTVMQMLFLGLDPSPLGFAPFVPPLSVFPDCTGSVIGLNIAPHGTVQTMPLFGGFVGGDIVAGVLAVGLRWAEQTCFFIDIGTNGEMVLRHNGTLYTAATAAGPAFEGSRIEYGTIAVPGAVDKTELQEDGTVISRTIGNVPATGICGSGLIDTAAELLRHHLIKPSGQFDVKAKSPFLNRWKIIEGKPAFCLVPKEQSGINEDILLTQKDVRQLQLAVGAIRAGTQLLLEQQRLDWQDIETFYVAGGFGNFIRPENAQRIGLLPPEIPSNKFRFCGNTSLAGARLVLLDSTYRNEAAAAVKCSQHVELASLPEFAVRFAERMIFP